MITKELMVAILAVLGGGGWVVANYLNSILRAISDIDKHHTIGMQNLASSLDAHVLEYKYERELSKLRFDTLTLSLEEENRRQNSAIKDIQAFLSKTTDFTVRLNEKE
ncbi:hypothetical protein Cylst_5417 [Cylindrospermum stagnale PCC 7417]|uniref:Uncharacterized protein n=1 Tax=Cylindrospermum stagnale PCC 7417 TaxID=56107 RepID=K9X713_9NOST|nr:hypothetical protein [Cylindrospermum stagnale]AFZ27437.1 hypothetical protein Cylst_5417 [Cylindrospermum stagnale PCC 7417]